MFNLISTHRGNNDGDEEDQDQMTQSTNKQNMDAKINSFAFKYIFILQVTKHKRRTKTGEN